MHIGVDADTGQFLAVALTTKDVDDGSQVGPLFDQIPGPLGSVTADGAYDGEPVYRGACRKVCERARERADRLGL